MTLNPLTGSPHGTCSSNFLQLIVHILPLRSPFTRLLELNFYLMNFHCFITCNPSVVQTCMILDGTVCSVTLIKNPGYIFGTVLLFQMLLLLLPLVQNLLLNNGLLITPHITPLVSHNSGMIFHFGHFPLLIHNYFPLIFLLKALFLKP